MRVITKMLIGSSLTALVSTAALADEWSFAPSQWKSELNGSGDEVGYGFRLNRTTGAVDYCVARIKIKIKMPKGLWLKARCYSSPLDVMPGSGQTQIYSGIPTDQKGGNATPQPGTFWELDQASGKLRFCVFDRVTDWQNPGWKCTFALDRPGKAIVDDDLADEKVKFGPNAQQ